MVVLLRAKRDRKRTSEFMLRLCDDSDEAVEIETVMRRDVD